MQINNNIYQILLEYKTLIICLSMLAITIGTILTIFRFKVVEPYQRIIITRFGIVQRILRPGLHILNVLENAIVVNIWDSTVEIKPQKIITQDNVTLLIDGFFCYHIKDTDNDIINAVFNIEDIVEIAENIIHAKLRALCAIMPMSRILSEREFIKFNLLNIVNEAIINYGFEVFVVEIKDIEPSEEITEVLNAQMAAEINRQNLIVRTEAEIESMQLLMNAFENQSETRVALFLCREYLELIAQNKNLTIIADAKDLSGIKEFIAANTKVAKNK